MSNTILVLGGNGKTGKRVISRLQKMNLSVRVGSRNASPAFDWENPETWNDALRHIQQVYISFQPDIAVPRAANIIREFVNRCIEAGVQKLVLLSGRGEEQALLIERMVMESGLEWTIVRSSFFFQNFSEGFFLDSILAGHMILPKITALEPLVDAEDIADVATAALASSKHSNKIYELTGPRLMTFEQAVSEISQKLNRPIQFQEVSMEEYTAMLESYQVSGELIWLIRYLFSEIMDGRNESLAHGVEQVLGRKPSDFSDYVTTTIASGFWNVTNQIEI